MNKRTMLTFAVVAISALAIACSNKCKADVLAAAQKRAETNNAAIVVAVRKFVKENESQRSIEYFYEVEYEIKRDLYAPTRYFNPPGVLTSYLTKGKDMTYIIGGLGSMEQTETREIQAPSLKNGDRFKEIASVETFNGKISQLNFNSYNPDVYGRLE